MVRSSGTAGSYSLRLKLMAGLYARPRSACVYLRAPLRGRAPRSGSGPAPRAREKVAALRRALDYFGISGEIDVPPSRFFRWRG